MAAEAQKALGIYEELRGETNPKIQQRALQRMQEMDDEKKVLKKLVKVYEEHASSLLEKLSKEFPWYLQSIVD